MRFKVWPRPEAFGPSDALGLKRGRFISAADVDGSTSATCEASAIDDFPQKDPLLVLQEIRCRGIHFNSEYVMSKTSAQILDELSAMSEVTNPATGSTSPRDTTRSPSVILGDKAQAKSLFAQYRAAILAETGRKYPVDGRPWQLFQYRIAHYIREEGDAVFKGNA